MLKRNLKNFIFCCFLLSFSFCNKKSKESKKQQNVSFEKHFTQAKKFAILNNLDSLNLYLIKLKKIKNSNLDNSQLNSYFGYYFRKKNQYDSAVYYYHKSLHFYEKDSLNFSRQKTSIYRSLSFIYSQISNDSLNYYYLKKSLKEAKKSKDDFNLFSAYNNLGVYFDKKKQKNKSINFYKEAYKYNLNSSLILQNIGSSFIQLNQLDSAKYYLSKAISTSVDSTTLSLSYFNLSRISKIKKNQNEHLKNLKISEIYLTKNTGLERELHLNVLNSLINAYKDKKDWEKVYFYSKRYYILSDSINKISVRKNIDELRSKYNIEKKEEEITFQKELTSSEKRKKKHSIIAAIILLLFTIIIAFISLKSSKRKRQLAEQQKELEAQKNITLIKEQEITSINAMVSGQEKERKRIAEDLHDNIGSVLATLKLHFENLKLNRKKKQFNQEELYLKTEHLIDETYLKVRSLAHAKNSGVIANQGLLSAIKVMAEKISSANKTQIDVVDFGLDKPLENSLEITIFRIIQELTTNIIKHAQATNATINLSLFDNVLNIIIEDNGKGFNIDKTDLKNGMGISSIKTRIEHLKGTFEIDSTLEKGTTILINIPV